MKTRILLLLFALAATTLQAQRDDVYSLWHSAIAGNNYEGMEGQYIFTVENLIQQHNGDFFIEMYTGFRPDDAHLSPLTLGNVFYKVSSSEFTLVDSLFVADTMPPYYLIARNPQGEGNIRANIEYDEDRDSTFLRISHFQDDSFFINHDEDILTPLHEGLVYESSGYLLDCRGDIILKYYTPANGSYECHMARFGVDGEFKHEDVLPNSISSFSIPAMIVYSESPLQYYRWMGANEDNLAVFIVDSTFHLTNTAILNKMINEEIVTVDSVSMIAREYLDFNTDTEVIPVGGNEVLVCARHIMDTNYNPITAEYGVAVAKYDMRTMQRKGLIVFNDYPGYGTEAHPLGLKQMSDGTVYFLYREFKNIAYPENSIVIVKMDADLNVEWQRSCMTDGFSIHWPMQYPLLYENNQGEEEGIAWVGSGTKPNESFKNVILFALHHDGTVGVSEGDVIVRPYAFYPNPVKDQLRMVFSPDVQSSLVELYDLQGRRILSQGNAFERIDMSRLPAGIYTLRVTLQDGQVFSDKVVKE